ncbi:hypothetical protein SVIO_036000 [Streptomyces violaceusniger]|uniref:Uncharacterized protein n=1 Tax=Streptomyces violaceusniger TaxID=68280 RepID=A0A4D4L2Q5_STRVO|nr:hypothetical protein SVIO_036000 [Streptomyces violaceusniger]
MGLDAEPEHPQPAHQIRLPRLLAELDQLLTAPYVIDQDVQPALLRSIRSTSARTRSGSRWSVGTAMPVPPAAVISSAVSSMVSVARPTSLTRSRVVRPVA